MSYPRDRRTPGTGPFSSLSSLVGHARAYILLTLNPSPTNVFDRAEMATPSYNSSKDRRYWQVCIAALLIALVLYNPFLALTKHTDGPEFHRLASHRATVGASEMQHFTPVQAEKVELEAAVEVIGAAGLIADKDETPSPDVLQEEALPPQTELITSTWFRPPPTK